jgi:hypothetical protein
MNGKRDRNSWFDWQLLAVFSRDGGPVNENHLPSFGDD